MSWLTANWQLKLLALGLSLGMFAAVAFSQNPIIARAIKDAPVFFDNPPSDVMIVNPPKLVTVNLSGLRENVVAASPATVSVHVDVSKVKPGTAVVTAVPTVLTPGVTAIDKQIRITLTVDVKKVEQPVPIELRDYRLASGWVESSKPAITPPVIRVTGPASFFTNDLHAFVSLGDNPVQGDSTIPNLAVQFSSAGKTVSLPNTIPFSTEDVAVAGVELHTRRPNVVRQITLTVDVTGNPAPGYRITRVVIDTLFITVTGPSDVIGALDSIDIGKVDVAAASFDRIFRNQVIPLPAGVAIVGPSPRAVTVTVTIEKNPVVQPSPPPPSPAPSPTPTP